MRGPQIIVRHPSRHRTWILVPAGWTMLVPEVRSDEAPQEKVQQVFESGYQRGLRDALARRARDYARLYPELAEPARVARTSRNFVTLRGFDPEKLQTTFIPFENVGSAGKRAYLSELRALAEGELSEA